MKNITPFHWWHSGNIKFICDGNELKGNAQNFHDAHANH